MEPTKSILSEKPIPSVYGEKKSSKNSSGVSQAVKNIFNSQMKESKILNNKILIDGRWNWLKVSVRGFINFINNVASKIFKFFEHSKIAEPENKGDLVERKKQEFIASLVKASESFTADPESTKNFLEGYLNDPEDQVIDQFTKDDSRLGFQSTLKDASSGAKQIHVSAAIPRSTNAAKLQGSNQKQEEIKKFLGLGDGNKEDEKWLKAILVLMSQSLPNAFDIKWSTEVAGELSHKFTDQLDEDNTTLTVTSGVKQKKGTQTVKFIRELILHRNPETNRINSIKVNGNSYYQLVLRKPNETEFLGTGIVSTYSTTITWNEQEKKFEMSAIKSKYKAE